MLPLAPILGSVAAAIGLGAAAGLIVTGRSRGAAIVGVGTGDAGDATPGVTAVDDRRRTAARRASRALPASYAAMLEHQMVLAGRPTSWTMGKILVAKPLLTLVLALFALWFVSGDPSPVRIAIGLFAVILAFFVPDLLLYSRGVERQKQIELELPDTLDQMTISAEAGLGFEAAMAKAATNGTGPLAEELIRTLQDMSLGRTRRDAYEALSSRTSSVDLRRFTRAVIQADIYGIAIVDVLQVQASEMRLKRRQRAEEQAMKVPVKVLFPLMFCILPVLFIVILAPAALRGIQAFMGH